MSQIPPPLARQAKCIFCRSADVVQLANTDGRQFMRCNNCHAEWFLEVKTSSDFTSNYDNQPDEKRPTLLDIIRARGKNDPP